MCEACEGQMPDEAGYTELRNQAAMLGEWAPIQGDPPADFLDHVQATDRLRWEGSVEWADPRITKHCFNHVFGHPDPQVGLTLFLSCCWADRQMPIERVWSTVLGNIAEAWLQQGQQGIEGIFKYDSRMIREKTWTTPNGVAAWFANTVLNIAENGAGHGNLYRCLGRMMLDLLALSSDKTSQAQLLTHGDLVHVDYKRAWMVLMFLRRDRNLLRCLLTRALQAVPNGPDALRLWYSDRFDEHESQLPVDRRVDAAFRNLFPGIPSGNQNIAVRAMQLAATRGIPPSSFDVLVYA
ncbi:MAG: hypothetical protein NTV86_00575 [Planctomycetota bacterium]|nr:hypothetical protein [Planctomycetota bacterium]